MDETVVVVGGAGGIGECVVKEYRERGFPVVIGDINTERGHSIAGQYGARFVLVDVRDYDSVKDLSESVTREPVYHVVNLAGWALPEEFHPMNVADPSPLEDSVHLNLTGSLYLLNAFKPLLASQGGDKTYTVVSSINARQSWGLLAYSAAKAGLVGLVHSAAMELGKDGIRINAVMPGTVSSPISERHGDDRLKNYRRATALGRFTTPKEVAQTIFAVTHLMTSATGSTFLIDAGQTKATAHHAP